MPAEGLRPPVVASAAAASRDAKGLSSAEMTGRQVHRTGTVVLSLLMVVDRRGADRRGPGRQRWPLSPRLLLGVLFIAAGVARVYLEVRRGRQA